MRGGLDKDLCRGVSLPLGPNFAIDFRRCELGSLLVGDFCCTALDFEVTRVGEIDGDGLREGPVARRLGVVNGDSS